jgi:hypothetical protein
MGDETKNLVGIGLKFLRCQDAYHRVKVRKKLSGTSRKQSSFTWNV